MHTSPSSSTLVSPSSSTSSLSLSPPSPSSSSSLSLSPALSQAPSQAPLTIPEHLAFHNLKQAEHAELWFEDGNVIVVSQGTAFRVYRGLLCKRSSVFEDVFGLPPPKEGNDVVEGVPIVQTYDSAVDMGRFLRAIVDPEFFLPPPAPCPISTLESVLRLSSKYDVPHLRSRAIAHLLTTYPTSLASWRLRDETRTIPSVENTPFVVLNLAREFDLPWLVPSVAYCISSHDIGKTLEGAEWNEESQACVPVSQRTWTPGSRGSSKDFDGNDIKPNWVHLTYSDIKMCVKGRNNILLRQNAMALQLAKGWGSSSSGTGAIATGVATPVQQQQVVPQVVNPHQVQGAGTPVNGVGAGAAVNGAQGHQALNLGGLPLGAVLPGIPTNLAQAQPVNIQVPDPQPSISVGCSTPEACTHTRHRCAEILTRWGTAGFLDFFDEQYNAFSPNLCAFCVDQMKEWCKEKSEELWESLPGCFGFKGGEDAMGRETTPWEELERIRELSAGG